MPKINIDNLEPNSTYRLYLKGEQYNLPFIDIKTPKVLVKDDIKDMISSAEITLTPTKATSANITMAGITASASSLQYIQWLLPKPDSKTNARNRLRFIASSAEYSGDWVTYLSPKNGIPQSFPIASVSFGAQTDTNASIVFGTGKYNTFIDNNNNLNLVIDFISTNKTSTRNNIAFAITASPLTNGTVSGSTVRTSLKGANIGAATTLVEIPLEEPPTTANGRAAAASKPLVGGKLNIRISQDRNVPEDAAQEVGIAVKISDYSKIQLKNTSTIKEILIPIYRMRKSSDLSWTTWFICPLNGTSANNYKFYAPVIFSDAKYGTTPSAIKTSDLTALSSTPPLMLKTFSNYGTVPSSANFFQPLPTGEIDINNITVLFGNAGLPSQYDILAYLGYPDTICDRVQIGFIAGRYQKTGSSWSPTSWIPGNRKIFLTKTFIVDKTKYKTYNSDPKSLEFNEDISLVVI